MATKQNLNFSDIDVSTLDENQEAELQNQIKLLQEKIEAEKKRKIELAKKDLYESLENVAKVLGGKDILNYLLTNRHIDFKSIQEVEPVYLIEMKIQKTSRKDNKIVDTLWHFYEGKVIISDMKYANDVCKNGFEEFKKYLTEEGKKYLEDTEKRKIIIDFYNEFKPAVSSKIEF